MKKAYAIVKPILILICLLILTIAPLGIVIKYDFNSYWETYLTISGVLNALYYSGALFIIWLYSNTKNTSFMKIAVGVGVLFYFPQICMLLVLLIDSSILNTLNPPESNNINAA